MTGVATGGGTGGGAAPIERTLAAVIPTRGSRTLERCLVSLAADLATAFSDALLIVVDDATPRPIEIPAQIGGIATRLLRLDRRHGFGPAVNVGVVACAARWVAVVNDDVEVEPGCFTALVDALVKRTAWVACPAVEAREASSSAPGRSSLVDESLYRLVWDRATLRTQPVAFERSLTPHYPSGALALYDRACWDALGGYDERLAPYYWEDVDLGLRALARLRAGDERFRAVHVPAARARHERHRTVVDEPRSLRKTIYRRNRELILHRHLASSTLRRAHLAMLVPRALRGLFSGDPSHLRAAWWAWRLGRTEWRRHEPPSGALDALLTGPEP